MVELGTRRTIERVRVGNSPPIAACTVFLSRPHYFPQIPFFSEPFFLNFDADCEFRIAMSPEDLVKAGLEELGKKWG